MLRFVYISLLVLGSVWSRDPLRTRPMPTISNSLVNLGKMDISFYIGKDNGGPAKENFMPINSKPIPIIDECPCNSLRNSIDGPHGGSSSIINKILSSSDFFNLNKEATYGPQCCESHEESSITFEFGPKTLGILPKTIPSQPLSPFIFDSFLPPKKLPLGQSPLKPKAIEIFLFPKNKESLDSKNNKFWINSFGPKSPKKTIKKDIKIVGVKDFKNTFDLKKTNDIKSIYNSKNSYDMKNAYDEKYSYDAKKSFDSNNVNDEKNLKSVKSSFDLKNFDSLKYETVQPVTSKKEIGIKDQEGDSKSDEKEDTRKDMTNVSKPL